LNRKGAENAKKNNKENRQRFFFATEGTENTEEKKDKAIEPRILPSKVSVGGHEGKQQRR
jgi:hypothetical protein